MITTSLSIDPVIRDQISPSILTVEQRQYPKVIPKMIYNQPINTNEISNPVPAWPMAHPECLLYIKYYYSHPSILIHLTGNTETDSCLLSSRTQFICVVYASACRCLMPIRMIYVLERHTACTALGSAIKESLMVHSHWPCSCSAAATDHRRRRTHFHNTHTKKNKRKRKKKKIWKFWSNRRHIIYVDFLLCRSFRVCVPACVCL